MELNEFDKVKAKQKQENHKQMVDLKEKDLVVKSRGFKDISEALNGLFEGIELIKGKQGEPGEKGDTYVLTEEDRRDIASINESLIKKLVSSETSSSVEKIEDYVEKIIPKRIKDQFSIERGDIKKYVKTLVDRVEKLNKEYIAKFNELKDYVFSKEIPDLKKEIYDFWEEKERILEEKYGEENTKRIIEQAKRDITWSEIKNRPNIVTALAHLVDVDLSGATSSNTALKPNFDSNGNLIGFIFGSVSSGGGGGSLSVETPSGTVNDSNTTFTVANEPFFINVNGAIYQVGTGLYQSYAGGTITLSSPVGTGGFIRSYY